MFAVPSHAGCGTGIKGAGDDLRWSKTDEDQHHDTSNCPRLGNKVQRRWPDGLIHPKAPRQPSRLSRAQRTAIVKMIENGPIPAAHGVVRWRLLYLYQWIQAYQRHAAFAGPSGGLAM